MKQLEPRPQLYIVPIKRESSDVPLIGKFLEKANASDELTFCRVSFNDPLLICYSSGTTGAPKCIVSPVHLVTRQKLTFPNFSLGPPPRSHDSAEEDSESTQWNDGLGRDSPVLKHILGSLLRHVWLSCLWRV